MLVRLFVEVLSDLSELGLEKVLHSEHVIEDSQERWSSHRLNGCNGPCIIPLQPPQNCTYAILASRIRVTSTAAGGGQLADSFGNNGVDDTIPSHEKGHQKTPFFIFIMDPILPARQISCPVKQSSRRRNNQPLHLFLQTPSRQHCPMS